MHYSNAMNATERSTHTYSFRNVKPNEFQPEISYALTTSYPELFVNFAGWSFCFIQNYLFHFVHSFFPRIIFTFCVKLQCVRYRFWQKQMSGVGAHGMEAEQTLTFLHIHVYVYAWDMTDSAFVKGFIIFNSGILYCDVCHKNDWWLKFKHFPLEFDRILKSKSNF